MPNMEYVSPQYGIGLVLGTSPSVEDLARQLWQAAH